VWGGNIDGVRRMAKPGHCQMGALSMEDHASPTLPTQELDRTQMSEHVDLSSYSTVRQ